MNLNIKRFPHYKQPDEMDCGPTCLRMIAKHYGKTLSLPKLRALTDTTREGTSLLNLSDAAEKIGFRTLSVRCDFETLRKEAQFPCIALTWGSHYVIVYKIKNNKVYIADPAKGLTENTVEEFLEEWIGKNATTTTKEGIVLLLDTTPKFDQAEELDNKLDSSVGFSFLAGYLYKYKGIIIQLVITLFATTLLSLAFPFLTQSIVDVGIQNQDLGFIYLILFSQLFLTIGQTGVDIIRGWLLLHLSTRINISLVSDFFIKLMKLPMSFFDVKLTGDIMQRINDHHRIQQFLTTSTLNVIFSLFNGIIFGFLLAFYNLSIFLIFILFSVLYFGWIFLFLKKRGKLDNKKFGIMANEQSKVMELINGMQDIKLHNAERQKRWGWEYIQAALFKVQVKSLALEQMQSVGSTLINHIKDILITIFAAKAVIEGEMTLGTMLAVSYIVGQVNAPINQFISFVKSAQDAKLSLERLTEIHQKEEEVNVNDENNYVVPDTTEIEINDVSFKYPGSQDYVLNNINLVIPTNKVTAIVGASGGGKTTLLKLLMKYYEPTYGQIRVGGQELKMISPYKWREMIGVVMQEGYVFNDTIARNIAVKDEIDKKKLLKAAEIANITEYIKDLPLRFNTKLGSKGGGMSTGQKQRVFIARAVYKDPKLLLFDEPTSSLDANNERAIMDNLSSFFKNRTVIIIAHRLSTVRNADQIVVIEKGRISEVGNHESLLLKKGAYFNLVKNQLELEKLES